MKRPTVVLQKSPRLTEPARRLLSKALTAMVRYPETVDMSLYYEHSRTVRPTRKRPEPYCGTVACLAGHIVITAGRPINKKVRRDFEGAAVKALGGPRYDINTIFRSYDTRGGGWGKDWPKSARAQARAVVSRVKYWVRTGK